MNWFKFLVGFAAIFVVFCVTFAWAGYKADGETFIDELMYVMVGAAKLVGLCALLCAGLYLTYTSFGG